MEPQTPHPDGKPYCVAVSTTQFTYHPTLEAQTAQFLGITANLDLNEIDGITVESWEMQHGHWLLAESQELKPKPQS